MSKKKKYTKKQLRLAAKLYLASMAHEAEPISHFNCDIKDSDIIGEELGKIRDRLLGRHPTFGSTDEILEYVRTLPFNHVQK